MIRLADSTLQFLTEYTRFLLRDTNHLGMTQGEQHWGGNAFFLPNGVQLTEWLCGPKRTIKPAAEAVERRGRGGCLGNASWHGRLLVHIMTVQ